MSDLTPQQRAAVARRGTSVVLASGAGCGKTHVLTARYLSHLRDDLADVGQVVAITFTDRAARQMRERIRAAVAAERAAAATPEAAARWARHLRDLDTAPISTIHAFCGNLLRQSAVTAGLDPRFEVLDEVLAANLRAEALADCLQALLTSPSPVGEDLRELVVLYGWDATVETLKSLVPLADAPAWSAWCARPPGEVAADWLGPGRAALLPGWIAYLVAASPKVAGCLRLLERTVCTGPLMKANVARLLAETPRLHEAPDLAAAVAELTEAAKVGKERAKAWPDEETYEEVKKALEGFREELPARLGLFAERPEGLAEAVAVGQRFLRVAAEAARAVQDRKQRAGVVDFQDLLVTVRDLLRDHRDVRQSLQQRVRFVLVDELQDTDPVQMEVIEHLCGVGLLHGKLFAVGDHKQSVYRFRGAEVALFQDLRRRVAAEGRLGLTVNFRSQPAVLQFVNALFRRRVADYEPLAAHRPQATAGPCVEFLWSRRGEKESAAEGRAREADALARHVAALVAGGEPRVRDGAGGLRPVRPGDVVLLFRSMSHVAVYEAALRRHGLDYYLVGGRAFFAQQEIYDLLNLLRALENPLDAVSLAGTLRSPFGCLSDEALFVLARHPEGLWAGLHDPDTGAKLPADQRADAARARRFLRRWHSLKDRLPIAELLGAVFADCGYDAAMLFEFLGERKLANLWKLTDLARAFDRSGLFGLADFIARLGDLVSDQPREEQAATQPENADVVRLMSIHQAKGLEFSVVAVADAAAAAGGPRLGVARWDRDRGCPVRPPGEDDPPPFCDFGWRLGRAAEALADWQEDLRTLYVACTRAEDHLILSAALTDPPRPATTWMLTLAEQFDLTTGACRDPEVPPGERPEVRVVWGEGGPLAPRADIVHSGSERTTLEEVPDPAENWVAVPPECQPVVIPVSALEAALREPGDGLFGPPTFSPALAEPFDTEDNADRSDWRNPWRRWRDTPEGAADDVLRAVLARWDFADADGWQHLLVDALEAVASADRRRDELAPLLARFAASETRLQLARSAGCLRDAEFLTDWPAPGPGPRLAGTVDLLWRDGRGDWHLLAYHTDPAAGPSRDPWRGRRVGIAVQAWAVSEQFGTPPRTVALFTLAEGRVVQTDGNRLPFEKCFTELAEAWRALQPVRRG
jgi:ATP-dependent helicase/nuclease subunit A